MVYLAVLYFAELEYQTARELCSRLSINQTNEEEEKQTMNAACLLYIEDIVRILGLYVLLSRIKYDFPYNRRLHVVDLRLTPEVFALYLTNLSKAK